MPKKPSTLPVAKASRSVPKMRRDKAENGNRIAKAAAKIAATGKRPTAVAIAEEAGLSDRTVKRHKETLAEILEPFQEETKAIYQQLAKKLKKDPKAPELKLWNQTVHGWSERMIVAEDIDDPTEDVEYEWHE